jgi:hypothetical protein
VRTVPGEPSLECDGAALFFRQAQRTRLPRLSRETAGNRSTMRGFGILNELSTTRRNTARGVVPVRLSGAERAQIAGAAGRRKLTLSGFIRQAALQASAVVQGKVYPVKAQVPERGALPLVVVGSEPRSHWVEGVPVDASGRPIRGGDHGRSMP